MRAKLFSSISHNGLPRHEGLIMDTTSHVHATIMRICGCYSLNSPAEQNTCDMIVVSGSYSYFAASVYWLLHL